MNKNNTKKEPCRRHYFSSHSFKDCPECGFSGVFTIKEKDDSLSVNKKSKC